MKHLTVRNLPESVARAIERETRRRGKSRNQTVIELLGQSLGAAPPGRRNNGFARLAGTWSAEEHRIFEAHIQATEQIDAELWR